MILLLSALVASLVTCVNGKPVNRTVDDFDVAPASVPGLTYTQLWSNSSVCDGCTAKPDPARAHKGSWHDTTYRPGTTGDGSQQGSASLTFEGTAVYVYFILPQTTTGPNGHVSCSFSIDGETIGSFSSVPPGRDGYLYDQLAFSQRNLGRSTHTLTILNSAPDGQNSLILLDRVDYTTDDGTGNGDSTGGNNGNGSGNGGQGSSNSGSSGLGTGAIVGIVVGVVAVIAIAILSFLVLRKRKKDQPAAGSLAPLPFDAPPPPQQQQAPYYPPQPSMYETNGGYSTAGASHHQFGNNASQIGNADSASSWRHQQQSESMYNPYSDAGGSSSYSQSNAPGASGAAGFSGAVPSMRTNSDVRSTGPFAGGAVAPETAPPSYSVDDLSAGNAAAAVNGPPRKN